MVSRKNKSIFKKMSKTRRQNKTKKRGGFAMLERVRSAFRTPDPFPFNKLPIEMRKRLESKIRMFGSFQSPGKTPYNGRNDPVIEYCAELSKAKAKKEYFTPEMEADLEFCKSNKLI
jgi:hypothetical protein